MNTIEKGKHTAGPWRANEQRSDGTVSIVADKQTIAMAWDFPEAEANARLIAAAPELLEVLRVVTAELEGRWLDDLDCVKQAKSAIAKAEGRD